MSEHFHRRHPDRLAHAQRPPTVQRLTVIAVSFLRGEGCCDEDPVRECVAYYHENGDLLHVLDPWADQ